MLSNRNRRLLLSLHLTLNAIWIGGLGLILFILSLKSSATGTELATIDRIIFRIHDVLIINVSFGVVITGLLFSLLTKWGFFKYYWVTAKWISLAGLFVVAIVYVTPAINGMAAISDVEGSGALESLFYRKLESETKLLSWIQFWILLGLVALSVFKPWGARKSMFSPAKKLSVVVGTLVGVLTLLSAGMQYMQIQSYRNMPVNDASSTRSRW